MNTLSPSALSFRSFAAVSSPCRRSGAKPQAARETAALFPRTRAAEEDAPVVRGLALPAPPPTLAQQILAAVLALAAAAALVEALGMMFRLAPPWEGFNGWAARILL